MTSETGLGGVEVDDVARWATNDRATRHAARYVAPPAMSAKEWPPESTPRLSVGLGRAGDHRAAAGIHEDREHALERLRR
jgi:hypothetical protein